MKEEQHMRTSIIVVALAAVAPVMAQAQSPTWRTDYAAAKRKAATQQKPLAIVFGQGAEGWQQLGGGSLAAEANRILAEQYVCCYVDTATSEGRALARQFELRSPVGVVLSDRGASVQALWHEGSLPTDVLIGHLTRYADPTRRVTATDTNPPQPSSNYPPPAPFNYGPPAPFAPAPFFGIGGFSGGGGCRS
jgi:hypothetical protein